MFVSTCPTENWPNNRVFGLQVRVVKIKPTPKSTSLLLPVDAHPLLHLRLLPCQLGQCRAAQWPLSLPGSRCPPCSRCSRNRTASRQSRSPRAWTQWGSCKRESTGIYLYCTVNTVLSIQKHSLHIQFMNRSYFENLPEFIREQHCKDVQNKTVATLRFYIYHKQIWNCLYLVHQFLELWNKWKYKAVCLFVFMSLCWNNLHFQAGLYMVESDAFSNVGSFFQ